MSKTKINTGGPVYPQMNDKGHRFQGITLRDEFAGKAMQTLLQLPANNMGFCGCESVMDEVAKASYKMADAMIKAREE